MKIQRFDTVTNKEKKVLFGEVVKNIKGKLNNIEINYRLLNNETLKNGRFEFKRKVS